MKKALIGTILVLFVSFTTASADLSVGSKLYIDGYVGGQIGGPMVVHAISPSVFPAFNTFCIEVEENVWVNGGSGYSYTISGIGTTSVAAGKTETPFTAWLYTTYLNNGLSGYTDSQQDRNSLQYSLWKSVGYTDTFIQSHGNGITSAMVTRYNNWTTDFNNSGWTGNGNVRIANLLYKDGSLAQDILIIAPIPAPAALLLGAMGLGLVGWIKRKVA